MKPSLAVRAVARAIDALVALVAWITLALAIRRTGQGWHDRLGRGTRVVTKR